MKRLFTLCTASVLFNLVSAQTYTHPTTGMGGEYVGACMVNTCSGTYYDNGGAGGNYSANINNIYRTFCPNAAGQCVRVCFSNINFWTANCVPGNTPCDRLLVINGATQNDPTLGQIDHTDNGGSVCFTGSSSNGCLTFRFRSISSSATGGGWSGAISCVACAANTTGNTNTDACAATPVCSNASFSGTSTGPGLTSDGCTGCNTSEHYTNWYYFCAQTSGVFTFTIVPSPNSQDYDFALYGPNVTCTSLGSPIRCSYAAGNGNTGMVSGAGDNSENVSGNGWVESLNVTAGQCFYLMVNKWDAGGQGFTVSFGSGVSLDCSTLPVELLSFNAECVDDKVFIEWETASELNSDYFTIERSIDGENFSLVERVKSEGSGSVRTKYFAWDTEPFSAASYYRLSQTDFDGTTEIFNMIALKGCGTDNITAFCKGNEISVSVNAREEANYFISVYDAQGKLVETRSEFFAIGKSSVTFPVNAQNGIYLLKIFNEKNLKNQKISIQR